MDIIFSWDSTNLKAKDGISYKLDMRSQLYVALYAGHPYASRKTLFREDLKDETILYSSPSSTGDSYGDLHYMQLYEKAGFQPNILLKSNDVESILMMVAAEEGITILPSYSVEKLSDADNLLFVPLSGSEEYEEVLMLWKKEHNNAALQCLLDF